MLRGLFQTYNDLAKFQIYCPLLCYTYMLSLFLLYIHTYISTKKIFTHFDLAFLWYFLLIESRICLEASLQKIVFKIDLSIAWRHPSTSMLLIQLSTSVTATPPTGSATPETLTIQYSLDMRIFSIKMLQWS